MLRLAERDMMRLLIAMDIVQADAKKSKMSADDIDNNAWQLKRTDIA